MNSFDIILPSNTSIEGNKTNCFTVRLPRTLTFESGRWDVAITSLTYPRTWSTFSTSETQFFQINWLNGEKDKIALPKVVLKKPMDVADLLSAVLNQTTQDYAASDDAEKKYKGPPTPRQYPYWGNIKRKTNDHIKVYYKEHEGVFKWALNHTFVSSIKLSSQLQYIMGFKDDLLFNGSISNYSCDITGGLTMLQIVAPGLINPVVIGNTSAPLLRLVGVKGKHGEIVEENFLNPQYRSLLSKNISQVHIEIRSLEGSLIPFEWGSSVCILNFRKRPLL